MIGLISPTCVLAICSGDWPAAVHPQFLLGSSSELIVERRESSNFIKINGESCYTFTFYSSVNLADWRSSFTSYCAIILCRIFLKKITERVKEHWNGGSKGVKCNYLKVSEEKYREHSLVILSFTSYISYTCKGEEHPRFGFEVWGGGGSEHGTMP